MSSTAFIPGDPDGPPMSDESVITVEGSALADVLYEIEARIERDERLERTTESATVAVIRSA